MLLVQGLDTDVVLQRLTITGGRTDGRTTDGGGGIRADRFTTLTLDHSTVTGNGTTGYADGGGIFGSDVTLTNSTVSDNSTTAVAPEVAGSSSTIP